MREYTKKPENQSRTLDSNPRAARQAPISEILQAYKNGNLGRQSVQRESIEDEDLLQTKKSGQAPASDVLQRYKDSIQRNAPEEDEELLQGKFDTAQRTEIGIDEEKLLQGKFESDIQTEQEPIQREEKPNNTGLPDNLKTGIENLSGYSMDDVKVHYNSDKPAQLQALAYAQGTDIHVAPGQGKYLPHEAWHIVQQKQGRVQPTMQLQGVNVNDNERLENEADVMGGKSLSFKLNVNNLTKQNVTPTETVQRWVKMNKKRTQIYFERSFERQQVLLSSSYTSDKKPIDAEFVLLTDFKETLQKVCESLDFIGIPYNDSFGILVREQLKNWMSIKSDGTVMDSKFGDFDKRAKEDILAEMRYYNTYEELAWALIQSLGLQTPPQKRDTKNEEQLLASIVLTSTKINDHLSSLIHKIFEHIKSICWEIKGRPAYGRLHGDENFKRLFLTLKMDGLSVRDQISRLHDMKDLFLAQGYAMQDTKEPEYDLTTERGPIKISKETMRYNVGTLDEADPWTLFMRERGRNLWAGPSYTTYQMLEMARTVRGTADELEAVAYAIFAYWCMVYPHTATPIHTFHEVMTPAQSFGVRYIPELTVRENAIKSSFLN